MPNILQLNSMTPIRPHPTNVEEQPAASHDLISVVKAFATTNCALCAKERIAILKQSRSNRQLLVNSNKEICCAMPVDTDHISTSM